MKLSERLGFNSQWSESGDGVLGEVGRSGFRVRKMRDDVWCCGFASSILKGDITTLIFLIRNEFSVAKECQLSLIFRKQISLRYVCLVGLHLTVVKRQYRSESHRSEGGEGMSENKKGLVV